MAPHGPLKGLFGAVLHHSKENLAGLGLLLCARLRGAHRLRLLEKIFVHVYGWHNPYTHSPTPSSPPGLPPSVPPSVQCINPLKERHITIVSCTK